jgi:hypothetical protein
MCSATSLSGRKGCGEHKADLALLQDVRGPVALARLGAGVRHQAEAHGDAVEVGGLACIADIELDVIGAVQLQGVLAGLLLVVRKRGHKT